MFSFSLMVAKLSNFSIIIALSQISIVFIQGIIRNIDKSRSKLDNLFLTDDWVNDGIQAFTWGIMSKEDKTRSKLGNLSLNDDLVNDDI